MMMDISTFLSLPLLSDIQVTGLKERNNGLKLRRCQSIYG